MKNWYILSLASGTRIMDGFASEEAAVAYLTRHGSKWPDDHSYTAIWSETLTQDQWDALEQIRQLRAEVVQYEDELRRCIEAAKVFIEYVNGEPVECVGRGDGCSALANFV